MGAFCVVILAGLFAFSQASHFEGGTIYWKVLSGTNVQFDWSQGWRLTAGPCGSGCSTASIGLLSTGSTGSWVCISGCSGNLAPVQYTVTGVNIAENWEQGVNSFTYNFGATGSYTVGYTGNAWRSLSYGTGGSWAIQTEINLGTRSDTGSDNASPLTAFSPIYRLQFGCAAETITIPMLDPNGDPVSCRWASGAAECLSVCNSLPAATLNSIGSLCTITVQTSNSAYTTGGWYAGAVQLDDFPRTSITMGGKSYSTSTRLSSVPVQFLVYTPGMTVSCASYPLFVSPTPAAGNLFSIPSGGSLSVTVKAQSVNSGFSITSITPAGPAGGVSSSLSSSGQIVYNWTPSSTQTGGFNLCFTAQDGIGKTATRCFSAAVAVQCTDPGTPPGMTRSVSSGPPFYYGDIITHTCPTGNEVTSGNAVRTCQLSSTFDGSAPVCSKVSCGNPNGHNNATQTGSSYLYQDVVSWTCNSGYERSSGDSVIQCAVNKLWNGTALQCTRVSCPAVSAHNNATQAGSGFRYLDSVSWACHTGYEPDTGNATIQCQANRAWTGTPLTCKRITCPAITKHSNTTQIGTGNRYLDVLSWTCSTGYERLSGDYAVDCQATRAWNGTNLVCHRKNCTSTPPYVSNSSSVHTDDRYLGSVLYTADTGYEVATGPRAGLLTSSHVCQANRTWSGSWPSMIRVPCNLTVPKNTYIKTSSPTGRAGHASPSSLVWRYLDSVEWECDTGYVQTGGNKFQACHASRAFNGTGMNCTDMDECISGPCANGGNCLNSIGLFSCACVNGYTGSLCTIAPTLSASMQALLGGAATGGGGGGGTVATLPGTVGTSTIGSALGSTGIQSGTLAAALGLSPSAGTHVSACVSSLLVGILLAAFMRLR